MKLSKNDPKLPYKLILRNKHIEEHTWKAGEYLLKPSLKTFPKIPTTEERTKPLIKGCQLGFSLEHSHTFLSSQVYIFTFIS